MKKRWQEIQGPNDWKKFEEFACILISHLIDSLEVKVFQNIKTTGKEIDTVICSKENMFNSHIAIEAKNRKICKPEFISQINTLIDLFDTNVGFLVTKAPLKSSQIETIRALNSKDRPKEIIPIQGYQIDEFFNSKKSTLDFLLDIIHMTQYKIENLDIKRHNQKSI